MHSPTTCSAPVLALALQHFPSPSSSSQAWLQHCLLQKGSFHSFPLLLHLPPWGNWQSLVQNLAGSGVEHSFPVLYFEHPPCPKLPGRGWDSSGVFLTRTQALLRLRYVLWFSWSLCPHVKRAYGACSHVGSIGQNDLRTVLCAQFQPHWKGLTYGSFYLSMLVVMVCI